MCGIFGIINRKPAKFDRRTFNILGYANDARGGDSCGIFIDGKYEYGTGTKKYYQDFYDTSELLKSVNKVSIALGHDRKASVGAVNESTAQPVIIKENDKPVFIVLHNGTIRNYYTLAKKYIPDVNIAGMTDSQIMAHIFYYKGYDVLAEYEGGSVFFIVDYREDKPKILFFKGASKYNDKATKPSEERPFYFVRDNNSFVFSSLDIPLCMMKPDCELYTANDNILIELTDNHKLHFVKEYDRSDKLQTAKVESNYGGYYGYGYYGGDYYNSYYNGGYSSITPYRGDVNKTTPNSNNNREPGYYVVFDGMCFYKYKNENCHGEYILDCNGLVRSKLVANTAKFYFYNGILLRNKECFDFLESFRIHCLGCKVDELIYFSPELVCYCSPFPIRHVEALGDYLYHTCKDGITMENFNGVARFLFTTIIYNYTEGSKGINTINCNKSTFFNDYVRKGFEEVNLPVLDELIDEYVLE